MSDEIKAQAKEQSTAEVVTQPAAGLAAALERTQQERSQIEGKLSTVNRRGFDEWWAALISEVTASDFKFDGTALRSVENRIAEIDEQMSVQLAAIMHHPEFQKLEGTWRGLHRLVINTEIKKGELEIHVLNCSKDDLADDFAKAGKPHNSELYKKTVRGAYQVFGGVPFGILIGDYEWTRHPADIAVLTDLAKVASASHTCVITSPSPKLFGFDTWESLNGLNTNDFADIFQSPECIEWRNFRELQESRYITMTMPRTLARLPFGNGESNTKIKEFHFEEFPLGEKGENIEVPHSKFCWSNSAFALGERITESFFVWGWTTAIRGVENGGLVRDLPLYKYVSPKGDTRVKSPAELVMDFEQEYALSNQGFCPLQYYLEKNYSVFAGGQTAHKPREVVEVAAQESENLSARLPYLLAVSRVSHYLKAIAHDKVGSFLERTGCQLWLNNWIMNYVDRSENPTDEIKRRRPFKSAEVFVSDKPGDPGFYEVKILLAPWIQFEGMTADMTLVGDIEKSKQLLSS